MRLGGARITKSRQTLVAILGRPGKPLTASEIIQKIKARKCPANKTTVYRELAFLEREGTIRSVFLADGEIRYELADRVHHHHLFCLNCKSIKSVKISERACEAASNPEIKGFEVMGHSIEMFGICAKCQGYKKQ